MPKVELKNDRELMIYNKGAESTHRTAPETDKRLNFLENHMVTREMFHSKIDDLRIFFNDKFEANENAHIALLEQQKKTNGSVKELKAWKLALVASWTVVTVLCPILFFYFMQAQDLKTEKKIQAMIEINNNKYFEEIK